MSIHPNYSALIIPGLVAGTYSKGEGAAGLPPPPLRWRRGAHTGQRVAGAHFCEDPRRALGPNLSPSISPKQQPGSKLGPSSRAITDPFGGMETPIKLGGLRYRSNGSLPGLNPIGAHGTKRRPRSRANGLLKQSKRGRMYREQTGPLEYHGASEAIGASDQEPI